MAMQTEYPAVINGIRLSDIRLKAGAHRRGEGACAMEVVSLIYGEPFSDHPACASPVVAAFVRSWNDALSADDRDRLLKPLIPVIGGTVTTAEDESTRSWLALDWLVRVHTPAWLRLAGLTEQADSLEAMPPLTPDTARPLLPILQAVRRDSEAVGAAAGGAVGAAAAGAAAEAAAAAGAASRDAARDAAWADARDALRPTVEWLQASAQDLVRQMCAVPVTQSAR